MEMLACVIMCLCVALDWQTIQGAAHLWPTAVRMGRIPVTCKGIKQVWRMDE